MEKVAINIAKPTKVILWLGFALSFIFSVLIGLIALDHSPQNMYAEGDESLLPLMLLAFAWVFVPFTCFAGLTEWVIRFRRRRQ